ncbi:MAG: hypothetical protein ACRCXL_06590, partial [Dermatophilaceae bacterium]
SMSATEPSRPADPPVKLIPLEPLATGRAGSFAPWDRSAYPDHYDAQGRVTKPFELAEDVVFAARATAWTPVLSPDFDGDALLTITSPGIVVDGNDVVVDARAGSRGGSVDDLLQVSNWDGGAATDGLEYGLEARAGVKATVVRELGLTGFENALRLSGLGEPVHPLVVDGCTFARSIFGVYTNGNAATIQRSQVVENGKGGIYAGSKTHRTDLIANTWRDNALLQDQASYADVIGDTYSDSRVAGNTFAASKATTPWARVGVSLYRNPGESNNLREEIPSGLLISDNTFTGYTVAVHVGSRMGRNVDYDITQEGRDYAFGNTVARNRVLDSTIGIKVNSEGNTLDSNTFERTDHPVVLHPVFFDLMNTTITGQADTPVEIWDEASDYRGIQGTEFALEFHDDLNQGIAPQERRVQVFTEAGTPRVASPGGLGADLELNNDTVDPLVRHHVGAPADTATGDIAANLDGDEVAAIYQEPVSRVDGVDYHSIVIYDTNGTEINRSGRSVVGYSAVEVGYFTRDTGEMQIAATSRRAVDGRYPVYIFDRGFMDPVETRYTDAPATGSNR